MGHYLRQVILGFIRWAGILRLLQFIHRKQIVIWIAHGVMNGRDDSSWTPLRPQLSPEKLDKHLRLLSKRYRFVSLMDAVEMLQGHKPLQPYSMVLTFDDGYRNNLTHALPILRRYGAPAAFFLPTGFLDNPRPLWFDRLDYALQHVQVHDREVRVGSFTMRLDGHSREALRQSYLQLRRTGKRQLMSDEEFIRDTERLAAQFEAESGCALADIQSEDDWSAMMTWEQVRQVADDRVAFGSHTVDHVRLALIKSETARDQLMRSKRDIETRTGKPCLSLCYPDGNFTDETVRLAKECGYRCGLTTEEGLNSVGDNLMTLKRIHLPIDATGNELLALTCGLSQCLSRMKSRMIFSFRGLGAKSRGRQVESCNPEAG
jgi:peptidoglycan/xylan/chitin deacetylase (PgdA/CDA1 family)